MKKIKGYLKIIGSQESSWLGIPTLEEIDHCLRSKLSRLNLDYTEDTWDLLESLAKTPAAITNLMRYYYEPTDEDRLLHRKLPSGFHRQLAKSISSRSGQIIVTTNRDRLIEWSLANIGITPQIISKHQDLLTLLPLSQTRCTVIKLNGDYLDLKPPQFSSQFAKLIAQIQKIYEPDFCRCHLCDRSKLAEFKFENV